MRDLGQRNEKNCAKYLLLMLFKTLAMFFEEMIRLPRISCKWGMINGFGNFNVVKGEDAADPGRLG
jgi:hypothetical protein